MSRSTISTFKLFELFPDEPSARMHVCSYIVYALACRRAGIERPAAGLGPVHLLELPAAEIVQNKGII